MSNVGLNRFTFCIKCLRTLQASYSVISSNNYSDAVAVVVVATLAVYSRATCLAKAFVICQTKRVFVHWQTNVSYMYGAIIRVHHFSFRALIKWMFMRIMSRSQKSRARRPLFRNVLFDSIMSKSKCTEFSYSMENVWNRADEKK